MDLLGDLQTRFANIHGAKYVGVQFSVTRPSSLIFRERLKSRVAARWQNVTDWLRHQTGLNHADGFKSDVLDCEETAPLSKLMNSRCHNEPLIVSADALPYCSLRLATEDRQG